MKSVKQILVIALSVGIFGCGGGGGRENPSATQETDVAAPTVSAFYESGGVVVTWGPVPNATAYNVYWATGDMPRELATKAETAASSYVLSPATAGVDYYFTVTAVGPTGRESAASEKITVSIPGPNRFPVASFVSPSSVLMDEPAVIDASASSDTDGSIYLYTFDFGDGNASVTQNSSIISHTYTISGTYFVTLTVTDDKGAVGSAAKEISVGFLDERTVNVSRTQNSTSQEPVGAIDSSGNPVALWNEWGSIYYAKSPDMGMNFFPEMYWDPQGIFSIHQPAIAVSGYDVFFSLTLFPSNGGAEIVFTHSKDGSLLSDPKIVSTIDAFNSISSSIAATQNEVAIAWDDTYLGAGPAGGVMVTRSLDAGDTFSAPVNVAVGGSCPNVALYNGRTYLSWIDGYTEKIFFAASVGDGTAFSSPVQISTAPEKSWCPEMKVHEDGAIFLMWPQGSAFENRKIMLSRSFDGGVSFTAPKVISSGSDVPCGDLALDPAGTLYTTWSVLSGQTMKTYLAYSRDHGETFSPPMRLLQMGESGCPSISSGASNMVGIFWAGPPEEPPLDGGHSFSEIYFSNVRIGR